MGVPARPGARAGAWLGSLIKQPKSPLKDELRPLGRGVGRSRQVPECANIPGLAPDTGASTRVGRSVLGGSVVPPESWHTVYYGHRCLQCSEVPGNWDCD